MNQPLFTRRTALGALGGLAVAAIAGCAGPGTTSNPEPGGVETGGEITGELSFAHWRAEDQEAFTELATAFGEKYPGATVSQDITPSNDYQSQALNQVRGGAVGDAFPTFRGAQFEQFVSAGVYADLTDNPILDKYTPALIEAGAKDGQQWGLPYQVVFNMPVTNADLMSQAGITGPATNWDDYLGQLDNIKSSGVVPIAWPGGEVANAGQILNCMVANAAPEDAMAQIEAGTMKVTDDWFLDVLAKYQQLGPYFQPNSTGSVVEPLQQMFANGEAAMLATGSFHIGAVRALGAEFPMDLSMPITSDDPTYEGIYNATFILGVNTASDVQPLAMAWLEFLSEPANAAIYANATVQHVSVADVEYDDPDLKVLAPWLDKNTLLAPRFQFNDLDIRNAVETACVEAVGGKDPQAAAEDADRIIAERVG